MQWSAASAAIAMALRLTNKPVSVWRFFACPGWIFLCGPFVTFVVKVFLTPPPVDPLGLTGVISSCNARSIPTAHL
jgi:hypothetical protein